MRSRGHDVLPLVKGDWGKGGSDGVDGGVKGRVFHQQGRSVKWRVVVKEWEDGGDQ